MENISLKEPKVNTYKKLAHIRAVVGFLGEKSQYGWWDTNFLSDSGQEFLKVIFPRSAVSAGCNAAAEAAKRLHDERIGRGGVYHLFRLPLSIEEAIHQQILTEPDDVCFLINSEITALDFLKRLSSSLKDASVGPIQVGSEKQILTSKSIEKISSHYFYAFQSSTMCFPYFVGD